MKKKKYLQIIKWFIITTHELTFILAFFIQPRYTKYHICIGYRKNAFKY